MGKTPLHLAVRRNDADVVEVLLSNKADPNIEDSCGNTTLHISANAGFTDISKLLIDSGCKINERRKDGKTPLYLAVHGRNVADAALLLKNKADVNIQDRWGNTPLHISMFEGLSYFSQMLMDCGCNTNLKNWEGKTALDLKPSLHFGKSPEIKASKVYVSQKNPRHDIFHGIKDEGKDDSWMRPPTASSPVVGKLREQSTTRFPLKKRRALSSSEESELGASRKSEIDRTPLDVEPFPLRSGVLQDFKGSKVYASQERFRDKILDQSKGEDGDEDEDNPCKSEPTLSLRSKLEEQSSTEESGVLLKKPRELSSSEESEPGATRKLQIERTPLHPRLMLSQELHASPR